MSVATENTAIAYSGVREYQVNIEGQNTYGLVMKNISGPMTQGDISNGVPVLNFEMGAVNYGTLGATTGGMAGGKPTALFATFYSPSSQASPNLFLYANSAQQLGDTTLYVLTTGTGAAVATQLKIAFTNASVVSYRSVGGVAGISLMDVYQIAYTKAVITYTPVSPTGAAGSATTQGWDYSAMKASS